MDGHTARMSRNTDPLIDVEDYHPRRRSLRIAVVTETYPPEVNGVAVTIASLIEGLRERGHDLQLIRPRQASDTTNADAESPGLVLLRGLPIPRYPQLKMGLPSRQALVALWAHRRPDLVHVVTEGPLGWSAVQAAARLHIPVVSDFRTNFHSYSRHYGVGWLHKPILQYLRKFHNRTRVTMVPTDALRQALAAEGFRDLEVIARGVDTNLFHPRRRSAELRRSWGADENTPVALHVGRLAPEKNLGTLFAAFEAAQAVNPQVRLVLVGDGPERRELEYRWPRAIFAGTRRGVDLATHYASADAFLFPSTTETFGNVTPEAMASGLAVLAYDYAAAGQFIDSGINGKLVPFDHSTSFVRLATELLSDPFALRSLGLHARRTAEALAWSRVVAQLENVYRRTLAAETIAVIAHRSGLPRALTQADH